jgi:hypothetical protein
MFCLPHSEHHKVPNRRDILVEIINYMVQLLTPAIADSKKPAFMTTMMLMTTFGGGYS